ncbi:hypothetical protein HXX76_016028 [Chlamydomonas incerta]|uniref:Replitron HUH endonuclease domain-containing protein n=1 Tax=Chlamydomonas incerta TaxID=51695 RepID=A0A835VQU1_CHLIN|nr:hypothetical protein HXX76_016028 [Chlamydomonas incerta]|eukprot:KAG2422458.1 hypothetical protein HXX76_016028 [Chlamydomonas incerta]
MLGYVCKDAGEAHFRLVVSGVTSADLLEGMHLYQIYGESSLKKRKELGHTNWMERAFHWVISRFGGFEDVRFSVAATLTAMVRSGRYYPSAAWSLCRWGGAATIDRKKAEKIWRMVAAPAETQQEDITTVFFSKPDYNDRYFDDSAGWEDDPQDLCLLAQERNPLQRLMPYLPEDAIDANEMMAARTCQVPPPPRSRPPETLSTFLCAKMAHNNHPGMNGLPVNEPRLMAADGRLPDGFSAVSVCPMCDSPMCTPLKAIPASMAVFRAGTCYTCIGKASRATITYNSRLSYLVRCKVCREPIKCFPREVKSVIDAECMCRACRAVVVGIRERKSAEQGGAAGPSGSGGVAAANCCTPSKKRVLEFERGNVRLPGSAAGPAPKRAAAMPSIVLVTSSDEEWDMAAADIAAKYDGKLDRELGEIAEAVADAEADAEDSEAAEAQGSE